MSPEDDACECEDHKKEYQAALITDEDIEFAKTFFETQNHEIRAPAFETLDQNGNRCLFLIPDFGNFETKQSHYKMLRFLFCVLGAVEYTVYMEAWFVSAKLKDQNYREFRAGLPKDLGDVPGREEALVVTKVTRGGADIRALFIKRKDDGSFSHLDELTDKEQMGPPGAMGGDMYSLLPDDKTLAETAEFPPAMKQAFMELMNECKWNPFEALDMMNKYGLREAVSRAKRAGKRERHGKPASAFKRPRGPYSTRN